MNQVWLPKRKELTKKWLRDKLKELNLQVSGNKEVLVLRYLNAIDPEQKDWEYVYGTVYWGRKVFVDGHTSVNVYHM